MPEENKDKNKNSNKNIFESNKKYFTICIYALFVIAIGAFIVYLIMNEKQTARSVQKLFNTLAPFIIAFFIAYLLNPIVHKIDRVFKKRIFKEKLPRLRQGLSIFFSYVFMLSLLTIAFVYVIPQLTASIQDITLNRLPDIYKVVYEYLNNLEAHYPDWDFKYIQEKFTELQPQLINFGTNLVTNIFPLLFNISISIVKIIINFILSIVISCYMLTDKGTLSKNARRLVYSIFKKENAEYLCTTAKECNHIFSSFIVGKTIDSLIIGIICFILMTILRLPYGILLSVIVGLTNMIPYFGPFIGAVPGVLIYLFINPVQAIIFAFMILVLQQFDGLYLGPKILGESTGLKPLWVIFAITIGGAYFGVLGMFLGVPIVAVIAYLLNSFINRRLKEKNITEV